MTDLHGDPDQPVSHPLMGQHVTVTLARDDQPASKITGTLTHLEAGGAVTLRQGDGTDIYGWPALDITADTPPEWNPGHVPYRDSDVAAWIKRHRDRWLLPDGTRPLLPTIDGAAWLALDNLLDDYRDHADTGTPLDLEVEGPHPEESATCGATADHLGGRYAGQPPCGKGPGHEHGPDTDWKRGYHSNGHLKWPVQSPEGEA